MSQNNLPPYVFIGLGNPGQQYQMTRHNIGYMVIHALAAKLNWSFKTDIRFRANVAKGIIKDRSVHLVLPLTYMNLSGDSVKRYLEYYKLPLSALLVVVDDIALPFGQPRLNLKGGTGGHNGLKSVGSCLGTNEYMRLRMGIGHPNESVNVTGEKKVLADYVLENFNINEQKNLPEFVDKGVEVLFLLLKETPTNVMNKINSIPRQNDLKEIDREQ
ncbi:MAG: aminoacyl-tRNA hydrolase [Parachlamydiaceae bacterium]|nr:aminoacyl-tRNA hydrolase [Parachlamydiaceae bacterium]